MSKLLPNASIKSITRPEIIYTARTWLSTPFHHQGRKKGVGCDCLGLIVGIASELNILSKLGVPLANHDKITYHYQLDAPQLNDELKLYLNTSNKIIPGNIVIFSLAKFNQHLAIIAGDENGVMTIIHACMIANKVIEQPLHANLRRKISMIFSFT